MQDYGIRRTSAVLVGLIAVSAIASGAALPSAGDPPRIAIDAEEAARLTRHLARWQRHLADTGLGRACLTEKGEELGWLMSPPLNGYYWGYRATRDQRWVAAAVACVDAWLGRGVVEPDGYIGWPKIGAAGTEVDGLDGYVADSLLGEAMALRPIVLMSAEILATPSLAKVYGEKAARYIDVAKSLYRKWEDRGTWRSVNDGMVAVILPYGFDQAAGRWTDNYARRLDVHLGFTLPDNKQNLVASWLLAMTEATGDVAYRRRAAAWFAVMKNRMHRAADGTFKIWNYWEPAGPWDYRDDGTPKHWIGVHPNGGYYVIDTESVVQAHRAGLVFDASDITALVQTSKTSQRLWPALVPYDPDIRKTFVDGIDPVGWSEISLLPWYASLTTRSGPSSGP